jgi:dihydroorotase
MQPSPGGSLTFREATLVPPGGAPPYIGDLAIEGGRIVAVGVVERPVGEVIDARGHVLLPGVIDPQVHFREPGPTHKEDLETGSRAAAAGGVTAFLEMPNTAPPTTDRATLLDKHARAAGRCRAHWGFFLGATPDNQDTLAREDLTALVCGLKIFMGSSTGTLLVDDPAALEAHFAVPDAEARRVPIAVHAEDEARLVANKARYAAEGRVATVSDHPKLRDAEAALLATRRAVALAEKYRRRLHILHLSTADEAAFLAGRPRDGLVTSETLPQYLWLDARDYERLGTRAQMNPPVREAQHGEALWAALHAGVIDCLATDHAPHTLEEKARPYGQAPSGMPGVETLLPLMLHAVALGKCTLSQLATWLCEAPARCYGLRDKGRLAVGADGDVVLVDPGLRRTLRDADVVSRCGWTPFAGWTLTGAPVMTVLRGRPVYRGGQFLDGVYGDRLVFDRGGPAL